MHPTGGLHCQECGKEICSTAEAHGIRGKRCADPAKAAVMAYVERLARDGLACCSKLDSAVIELTLASGEVFHLGKTSVTRVI
jgi:hypothetical protein